MSFRRHRETHVIEKKPIIQEEKKPEVKSEPVKEDLPPVEENFPIVHDVEPNHTEEEEPGFYERKRAERLQAKPKEQPKPVKKKKKRVYKQPISLGLIGDTVEARDFRAICKKKKLQINTVLNKILHDWNTANYNL